MMTMLQLLSKQIINQSLFQRTQGGKSIINLYRQKKDFCIICSMNTATNTTTTTSNCTNTNTHTNCNRTLTKSKRLFSNRNDTKNEQLDSSPDEYLIVLGYKDEKVRQGMKDALKAVFGDNITVTNLKSLGIEGLAALSKSVTDQLLLNSNDRFIGTVHINVPHHNFKFDLQIHEGDNFMTAATTGEGKEILGEYLECACGGNMSCATCHIILDKESFHKLNPPCEAECDMLDLAFEPTDTSRLGCQVIMTKDLDGMTITIPAGVNNFWS